MKDLKWFAKNASPKDWAELVVGTAIFTCGFLLVALGDLRGLIPIGLSIAIPIFLLKEVGD